MSLSHYWSNYKPFTVLGPSATTGTSLTGNGIDLIVPKQEKKTLNNPAQIVKSKCLKNTLFLLSQGAISDRWGNPIHSVGDSSDLPNQHLSSSQPGWKSQLSLEREDILAFQVEWFLCFLIVWKAAIAAVWEKKLSILKPKWLRDDSWGKQGKMWWAWRYNGRCEAFHCGSLVGFTVVPLLQYLSEVGNPRACSCSSAVARSGGLVCAPAEALLHFLQGWQGGPQLSSRLIRDCGCRIRLSGGLCLFHWRNGADERARHKYVAPEPLFKGISYNASGKGFFFFFYQNSVIFPQRAAWNSLCYADVENSISLAHLHFLPLRVVSQASGLPIPHMIYAWFIWPSLPLILLFLISAQMRMPDHGVMWTGQEILWNLEQNFFVVIFTEFVFNLACYC